MRTYRRLRRHYRWFSRWYSSILLILIFFIFIRPYLDIISYELYIQTLDVQSYANSITIWNSDFHISPIRDLKTILIPLGVKFFDKSLSNSCSRTKTCASHLRILNRENAENPSKEFAMQFYEFYKDQLEMHLVDAFVCFHPVGMCELYVPFNRTIIIIASTRYELWRFDPPSWTELNENLKQIAQYPKNIIAANNLYD
ncbi:unnamed protein product, partial [Adineta ricciae]